MKMEVVRLASLNEKRFIISEALGISHCIVTISSYSGTLSAESPLHTLISKAIKHCIDEHPALSTIIKDANSEHPRLAQVDSIDLTHHLEHVRGASTGQNEEQQIKSFLECVHGRRLPPAGERPQWRAYVGETLATDSFCFYLAFMYSHVLCDGMSGLAFHDTFLRAMNGAETALALERGNRRPQKTRLPPIETAGNLTISWPYLLSILSREFLPTWLASALGIQEEEDLNNVWTGPKTRPPPKLKVGISPTVVEVALVPNSTLQRALRACRRHDARLTSLLNHLTARALCKSLTARGESYHKIKVGTAIDLRKALGKGQGAMANWVSALIETITVTGHDDGITDEFWEAIKQSTVRLAKASSTLANQPIGLIKYIPNLKQWTQSRASQPATVSFGMSNLGVFDGAVCAGGRNSWQVDTIVPSQSGNITGAPFDVNVASAKNGCLAISITWWPGMLGIRDEKAFVSEILDEIQAGMERIK